MGHPVWQDAQKQVRFKFQVGDRVKISKVKRMFEKFYLPNYTEEMFTIYKRFALQVPVYKLKDDAGEILEGTFNEPKLEEVNVGQIFFNFTTRQLPTTTQFIFVT